MIKDSYHSEKAKQKMREVALRNGNKPPSQKGISPSIKTRQKISIAVSKALIGHKHSLKTKQKMSLAKIGKYTGEKSTSWKGEKVSYGVLHAWVCRWLGKPDTCEHCGKVGLKNHKIHWANKSHQYKRNLEDWLRLCVRCHKKYYVSFS